MAVINLRKGVATADRMWSVSLGQQRSATAARGQERDACACAPRDDAVDRMEARWDVLMAADDALPP
ncbi:hypothetical protein SVAN01_00313 [Stagonosporopsis vannaccii]|nr:hypothetical protein SVAN01_00313 [Stagonosporopsis vannaccii]